MSFARAGSASIRDLVSRLQGRPILSGGLSTYAVVVACVLLFVAGMAMNSVYVKWNPRAKPPLGETSTSDSESPRGGTRSTSLTVSPGVTSSPSSGSGSSGTAAALVAADLAKLVDRPTDYGGQPPVGASHFLDAAFGIDVVPASAAGFELRGLPSARENLVTAIYAPRNLGAVDSLRLVIERTESARKASQALTGMLEGFDAHPSEYVWGGRHMLQRVTRETSPHVFPAAVAVAWTQDRYAMCVTVIPAAPGRTSAARDDALGFVDALAY